MSGPLPRILFVDDEPHVLDGLRRQLRSCADRWDMAFEATPGSAIERMGETPADVVVSDMNMPTLTGLDMIQHMRRRAPGSVYIMLTGAADLQVAVDAINEADIFRFYTKPCPAERLIEGIEAGLAARPSAENSNPAAAAGLSALDHIAVGVIVVDAEARVLHTNQSGAALLSAGDGLMLSQHEVCRAGSVAETDALHELIHRSVAARGAPESDTRSRSLALNRTSMDRPLSVVALALDDGRPGADTVALFVTDPERYPLPSRAAISDLFGLTTAEAGLVAALAQGLRLEDAADAQGITIGTARSYLKQVFSKTNTNRQPELIRLVLTTAPVHGAR